MRFFPILLTTLLAAPAVCAAQKPAAQKSIARPAPKPAATVPAGAFAGNWEAKAPLRAGMTLRLRIVLRRDGDRFSGIFSSPDQSERTAPLSSVIVKGRALSFTFTALSMSFSGELSKDGQSISGTLTQGVAIPLRFEKKASFDELRRPQTPKPPFPYKQIDVAYENPEQTGVKLGATLTIPEGDGPFPCAILISGSGAQDRDCTIFQHKSFFVIADSLARRGIATLRVDDRGVGKSVGAKPTDTSADFATDVRSGVAFLRARTEIDPAKIGLIGHSEGGMIAPMVSSTDPKIAFVVLLAGPGVSGRELLVEQSVRIAKASGAPETSLTQLRAVQTKIFDLAAAADSEAERSKKLAAALILAAPMMTKEDRAAQIAQITSPWIRYFLKYDPAPALKKTLCPVLILNGENDTQVDANQNVPTIEAALKAGGNANFKTVRLPALNHLFQTSKTGAPSEYQTIEETFAPAALDAIGRFLTGLFPPAK